MERSVCTHKFFLFLTIVGVHLTANGDEFARGIGGYSGPEAFAEEAYTDIDQAMFSVAHTDVEDDVVNSASGKLVPSGVSQTAFAAAGRHLDHCHDNACFTHNSSGIRIGEQDVPLSLKFNSWFQLRHSYFDSNGINPNENNFEFERLRLIFAGYAYSTDLNYFIQLDGDSDQSAQVDLLDYYIRYDVGHDLNWFDDGKLGVRLGQWKMPFNRARAESGTKLQFADRSMASVFFDLNRSVGIGLYGRSSDLVPGLQWEVALHNGFQNSGMQPGRRGQLDRNPGISGRVEMRAIGEWGSDGEPDLNQHRNPAFKVGAGFAFTRVHADGASEFDRFRAVDSGDTISSILPPGANAYSNTMFAIDGNYKCNGWSMLGEYYFRTIGDVSGASVTALFDHGFLLQSGCFLIPEKLEIIARYSRISGDSGTLGATVESADEVAGGLAWYIRGQDLKLIFDATHLNGSPLRDTSLNILPGDDGMLYRTQFQFRF